MFGETALADGLGFEHIEACLMCGYEPNTPQLTELQAKAAREDAERGARWRASHEYRYVQKGS